MTTLRMTALPKVALTIALVVMTIPLGNIPSCEQREGSEKHRNSQAEESTTFHTWADFVVILFSRRKHHASPLIALYALPLSETKYILLNRFQQQFTTHGGVLTCHFSKAVSFIGITSITVHRWSLRKSHSSSSSQCPKSKFPLCFSAAVKNLRWEQTAIFGIAPYRLQNSCYVVLSPASQGNCYCERLHSGPTITTKRKHSRGLPQEKFDKGIQPLPLFF
mmetsp:Transcript_13322/g.28911  ORF Transcript_13322/g.28911 Transcript_13322/m.28911 type:complete len:221 (+) Transcript_13322:119-781(+)